MYRRRVQGRCAALLAGLATLGLLALAGPGFSAQPPPPPSSIIPRLPRDFSGIVWSGGPTGIGAAATTRAPGQHPIIVIPNEFFFPPDEVALLKPWAREVLERYKQSYELTNPSLDAIHDALTPTGSCYPLLPGDHGLIGRNTQFLFSDDVILILHDHGNFARVIYMNEDHPKNLQPSWYGHSVGRWEGDTLVIDTVGYNDLSVFGGPQGFYHTTALHTIERYRLISSGRALEGRIRFEDPATLTAPYEITQVYFPAQMQGIFPEGISCQENNAENPFPISSKQTEPLG
jgi:hypothetical protein